MYRWAAPGAPTSGSRSRRSSSGDAGPVADRQVHPDELDGRGPRLRQRRHEHRLPGPLHDRRRDAGAHQRRAGTSRSRSPRGRPTGRGSPSSTRAIRWAGSRAGTGNPRRATSKVTSSTRPRTRCSPASRRSSRPAPTRDAHRVADHHPRRPVGHLLAHRRRRHAHRQRRPLLRERRDAEPGGAPREARRRRVPVRRRVRATSRGTSSRASPPSRPAGTSGPSSRAAAPTATSSPATRPS